MSSTRARHFGCLITQSGRTLFLQGELDLGTRHTLARAGEKFARHCTAERDSRTTSAESPDEIRPTAPDAIVDAAGLAFIDAAGLGALVTLHIDMARAGMRIRTIHPPAQLRRISSICQVDAILGLDPDAGSERDPGGPGVLVEQPAQTLLQRTELQAQAAAAQVAQLKAALETSRHIGAAIGIVMSLHKITEGQAFELLRTASQRSNRKMRDVALDVIDTGRLDPALIENRDQRSESLAPESPATPRRHQTGSADAPGRESARRKRVRPPQ